MIARTGRTIPLALALLALAAAPSIVSAQGNAMNPYGNSGYADYREFTIPSYGNNPALPGQSRLNNEPVITRPRQNRFDDSDDDGEDFESSRARRGSSAGMTYSEAYRRLNRQNNNGGYKPNNNSQNDAYVKQKREDDEKYANALNEKDPVKRSAAIRKLEAEARNRSSLSSRTNPSTAGRAPEPNQGSRKPAASTAPGRPSTVTPTPLGDRRPSAPPPVAGVGPKRSNSAGSAPPPVSGGSRSRTGGTGTSRSAPPDPSTIATPAPPR